MGESRVYRQRIGRESSEQRAMPTEGRLAARPMPNAQEKGEPKTGVQPLGIGGQRDGLLYVPGNYDAQKGARLAVMLHGAGGSAQSGLSLLQPLADANNLILLAPASRRATWDVIVDDYGLDVAFIDQALEQVFDQYTIDPSHVAIGGFSDGASYALSLGISNGDLFTHIIAFSPGFSVPARTEGKPCVYISHGTHDQVLPIDRCSRRIVPQLKRAGYDVTYREFDGPHTVPPNIAQEAMRWFTEPAST